MNARWQDQAACAGEDPELFFDPKRVEAALQVCGRCPVVAECRRFGERRASCGVFGGQLIDLDGPGPSQTNEFLEEHGTEQGYARHMRRKEPACERCRWGAAMADAERRKWVSV